MVTLLDSQTALDATLGRLLQLSEVAVDTEADSFHHYKEKLCLVQISAEIDGEIQDYLVDPLAGLELSALVRLLAAPSVIKVLHDVAYDLIVLKRDLQVTVTPVFDTMLALRFLGQKIFGLGAVLHSRFGFEANKALQRSDWSHRPLSAAQLAYAASDTHYLIPLARELRSELGHMNRLSWFEEECARLPARIPSTPRGPGSKNDEERFWSVKGVGRLRGQELALARALFQLREERARALDWPPFRVFPNEALFQIVAKRPQDVGELQRLKGVGPSLVRSNGEKILELCKTPLLPVPVREPVGRVSPSEKQARERRFETLREMRREVATNLALDPEVLLSNATLWELADHPQGLMLEHGDFAGWRRSLFAEWHAQHPAGAKNGATAGATSNALGSAPAAASDDTPSEVAQVKERN